jgi:hypothetical protein
MPVAVEGKLSKAASDKGIHLRLMSPSLEASMPRVPSFLCELFLSLGSFPPQSRSLLGGTLTRDAYEGPSPAVIPSVPPFKRLTTVPKNWGLLTAYSPQLSGPESWSIGMVSFPSAAAWLRVTCHFRRRAVKRKRSMQPVYTAPGRSWGSRFHIAAPSSHTPAITGALSPANRNRTVQEATSTPNNGSKHVDRLGDEPVVNRSNGCTRATKRRKPLENARSLSGASLDAHRGANTKTGAECRKEAKLRPCCP